MVASPSDDRPLLSWVLFRLRNALIAGVVLAVVATVGYVALEGYGWVDALYMTVITLGAAAADQDALSLVVVLTARAVRPDLRIVSRVNESTWLSRIQNAGADVAQSPYDSYGASLAASALSPTVLSLHNLPLLGLGTEEIEVAEASNLVGQRIEQLEALHVGVHILGLRRERHLHKWHEVDDSLRQGDVIVALGEPAHLSALVRNASSSAPGDGSR